MSLKRIIKEFQDKDIPLSIAKAISKFDSVGKIELTQDYPMAEGTEAFVYTVKSKKGEEYILRISKKVASETYWVDDFDKFENHNFSNIVEVYLVLEIKDYSVAVLEKLERTLHKEQEIEVLDALGFFMMMLNHESVPKVMDTGIIEYAYSDEIPETKFRYNEGHVEKYKGNIVANVARGGIAEKVTRDIAQGLEDYYDAMGNVYDDLHPDNVMVSKDGTYKLIDL